MSTTMKVGTRLAIGFGSVLVLLLVVAVTGIIRLGDFNEQVEGMADDRIPKILLISDWLYHLTETASHTRTMLILEDDALIKNEINKVRADQKVRTEAFEQLQQTVKLPKGRELLQKVVTARAAYMPAEDAFIQLILAGDRAAAKELLLISMRPKQHEYIARLREFLEFQKQMVQVAREGAANEYHHGKLLLTLVCVFGFLAGVFAAWLIARNLIRELGAEPDYVARVAEGIAQGDLAMPIHLQPGDNASLMFSISKMRDDLRQIVTNVRHGTDTITTGSSEIATGNQDLSSRTEQQASSLEETASSMEELTSTVKQNADNARQASSLSMTAAEVATRGGVVVSQVVSTMGAINDSAKKIVDIISVIDGIAFQTNILALNAAVEAARAGEQGRGFAVVAAEVRNLAQRSASAAKEIKTLIHDSVEKVDAGSRLVDQAGTTMNEVVASVRRVSDIIGEITAASQEQTAGIEQINEAISQMDNVTQQNAALVEEAAAAATSLQDQAANLALVVSVFKLDLQPAGQAQGTQGRERAAPVKPGPQSGRQAAGSFKPLLGNY